MIILETVLFSLMFALIITAVIQDVRTRSVQNWVSIPFGLIAIGLLVLHGKYLIAGLVSLSLYMPKGMVRQLSIYIIGIFIIINLGIQDSAPVLVALLLTDFMRNMEWYYGADVAFLFPIYGLFNDWHIFAWMTLLILGAQFYLNFKRYKSIKGMLLRARDVMNMVRKGQQPDQEALRTPAMVYITLGFAGYILIYPGTYLQMVISVLSNL